LRAFIGKQASLSVVLVSEPPEAPTNPLKVPDCVDFATAQIPLLSIIEHLSRYPADQAELSIDVVPNMQDARIASAYPTERPQPIGTIVVVVRGLTWLRQLLKPVTRPIDSPLRRRREPLFHSASALERVGSREHPLTSSMGVRSHSAFALSGNNRLGAPAPDRRIASPMGSRRSASPQPVRRQESSDSIDELMDNVFDN
jgi:hypothetical protein